MAAVSRSRGVRACGTAAGLEVNGERAVMGFGECTACYNTVWTPKLCKPDTSDRPYLFSLSTYLI
jgi:hypothetical protein